MAYILNFSGGKDSTALLLMILEKGLPLDYIINVDTTKEFPQMYEHIEKVKKYIGREIHTVSFDFDYYFRDLPKKNGQKGYGWASPFTRWCTKLKQTKTNKLLKELVPAGEPIIQYTGFAADEAYRAERKTNKKANNRYPLIEWGITEAQALQYCYDKGFDWGGLYSTFKRPSCFCCPLQPLGELKILYRKFPDLWQRMKEMDTWTPKNFKIDTPLAQLEERFQREIELDRRQPRLL